jgi:hypothetical protein
MVLALIKTKALTRADYIYKPVKCGIAIMPSVKGKAKLNKCSKCGKRHPPPTGSKCTRGEETSFAEAGEHTEDHMNTD